MFPASIKTALNHQFSIRVTRATPVGGGSINQAYKIEAGQDLFFLKYNSAAPDDFFEKEARGLQELKRAGSNLRIPEVIAVKKQNATTPGFLLLEFIEESRAGNSFIFGEKLARLHQTRRKTFGLDTDNYIGSLPQQNGSYSSWPAFFSEKRITPQLKSAVDSGKIPGGVLKNWSRLANNLGEIMPSCSPSLLHGDLWGGNYLFDATGTAVLIDPAVYYGHPEMDLSFSKMFGGFSPDFYAGYESVSPLEPGFDERVTIYNLYPLLVHVNLFGGHYISQFEQIMQKY